MWSQPPGEEPVRQIAFPRLRGDATTPMLKHVLEKLPPNLQQGPKVAIPLKSPSSRHWNIDSDLTFSLAVNTHCRRHVAKQTDQDLQQEFTEAEGSPRQAPVPEEVSLAIAGSSQAVSPTETAHQEKQDLEVVRDIVRHLHAVCLQATHDMGL